MAKISSKNLDLYYSDFKALKNVNLDIEEMCIRDSRL